MPDKNENNNEPQNEEKKAADFWTEAAGQFNKVTSGVLGFFEKAVQKAEEDPEIAKKGEQFCKDISDAAGKAGKVLFTGAALATIGAEKLGSEIAKGVAGLKARQASENAVEDVKGFAEQAAQDIQRSAKKAADEIAELLQKAQKEAAEKAAEEGEKGEEELAEEMQADRAENDMLEDEDLKAAAAKEIERCAKRAAEILAQEAEEAEESAEDGTEAKLLEDIRRYALQMSSHLATIAGEAEQSLVTLSEKAKLHIDAKLKKAEQSVDREELRSKLEAAAQASAEAGKAIVLQTEKLLKENAEEAQKDAVRYGTQAVKELGETAGKISEYLKGKLNKEFKQDAIDFAETAKDHLENLIRHCAAELDVLSAKFEEEADELIKAEDEMMPEETAEASETPEAAPEGDQTLAKPKAGRRSKKVKADETPAEETEKKPKKPRTVKKSQPAESEAIDVPAEAKPSKASSGKRLKTVKKAQDAQEEKTE